MRIVMIAAEISPFADENGLGHEVAELAASLAARGHELHAIVPLPPGADAEAHSLAKRLRPIQISLGDRDWSFARFDGRTPTGVEVHLLGGEDARDGYRFWDAFCAAAIQVLDSLGRAGTWCASWNAECAAVPIRDREISENPLAHLFVVRQLDESEKERVHQALAAADRVLIAGHSAAERCRSTSRELLDRMARKGHLCSVSLPVAGGRGVHRNDKASAKAALQTSIGLPVRLDLPLVLFPEPAGPRAIEALSLFLRGDVQVAVSAGGGAAGIDALLERYPDRLARLPGEVTGSVLLAADGCAVARDPSLTVSALSRGAVPVTTPDSAEGVVDLEPSLESGSALIATDDSSRAMAEALSRLAAAFRTGPRFADLTERLPRYAMTWHRASQLCEQLIGVVGVESAPS